MENWYMIAAAGCVTFSCRLWCQDLWVIFICTCRIVSKRKQNASNFPADFFGYNVEIWWCAQRFPSLKLPGPGRKRNISIQSVHCCFKSKPSSSTRPSMNPISAVFHDESCLCQHRTDLFNCMGILHAQAIARLPSSKYTKQMSLSLCALHER